MIQMIINGKKKSVDASTLSELVKELGLTSDSLVIELNRKIVKQEKWIATELQKDDVVELLSFVGGG